jgi:hypothetical protein
MTLPWPRTTLFVACSLAAGCDAEHDGDSVWTLAAAIVEGDAQIDEGTAAAIYWSNVGRQLDVLDQVDIEGDFPDDFTLRTSEPPPATAQISLAEAGIAALDIAIGVVVAVDERTAPFHPVVVSTEEPGTGAQLAPGETLLEGDDRAWLRGGAPGHLVVYLSHDPPDGGAACLDDFTQGYNLVALIPKTSAEVEANDTCEQTAHDFALEAYNAERGTDLTSEDLWNDEAAQTLVNRSAARLECQFDCDLFRLKSNVVPPDTRVTLETQADPDLTDWF